MMNRRKAMGALLGAPAAAKASIQSTAAKEALEDIHWSGSGSILDPIVEEGPQPPCPYQQQIEKLASRLHRRIDQSQAHTNGRIPPRFARKSWSPQFQQAQYLKHMDDLSQQRETIWALMDDGDAGPLERLHRLTKLAARWGLS